MMNIVVGSLFRDTLRPKIKFYFEQVRSFIRLVSRSDTVRVLAVEGDSKVDISYDIRALGARAQVATHVIKCNHGQPNFGSTENPIRLAALSKVANALFSNITETDDVLIYVESDLIWDPRTFATLATIAYQRIDNFDIVAPLIFAGKHFYDTWAFRKNGERFGPFLPYHSELKLDRITEVDSVGSCLAMRSEVARSVRIKNDYALVGFCEEARNKGYRIGAHANLRVRHP
jgi:hypothetical protein